MGSDRFVEKNKKETDWKARKSIQMHSTSGDYYCNGYNCASLSMQWLHLTICKYLHRWNIPMYQACSFSFLLQEVGKRNNSIITNGNKWRTCHMLVRLLHHGVTVNILILASERPHTHKKMKWVLNMIWHRQTYHWRTSMWQVRQWYV